MTGKTIRHGVSKSGIFLVHESLEHRPTLFDLDKSCFLPTRFFPALYASSMSSTPTFDFINLA